MPRFDPLKARPPAFVSVCTGSIAATGAARHHRGREPTDNATTDPMSDAVSVTVHHRLGKAEAVRRLKDGFARANGHLGGMITVEQAVWEGDTLRFSMRALGQTAAATIDVLDDALRIEVALPWLLAKAAKRLLPLLRREATQLLEKK